MIPIEELGVVLINDFSDGYIEISSGIADEVHFREGRRTKNSSLWGRSEDYFDVSLLFLLGFS